MQFRVFQELALNRNKTKLLKAVSSARHKKMSKDYRWKPYQCYISSEKHCFLISNQKWSFIFWPIKRQITVETNDASYPSYVLENYVQGQAENNFLFIWEVDKLVVY